MTDDMPHRSDQPVNLISLEKSPLSPNSKFHLQQQKEFAEVGRRQLEKFIQQSLFSNPGLSDSLDGKTFSSMDPLSFQNQLLNHFGSSLIHADNNHCSPSIPSRKRLSEENSKDSESSRHPLFSHGVCRWTGCEMIFESFKDFQTHLNVEHVISDRSTAQTRVQVQIVSQLEIQIRKEKDRLDAMMEHFNKLKEDEEEKRQLKFMVASSTDEDMDKEDEVLQDDYHRGHPPLPTLTKMGSPSNNNNNGTKPKFDSLDSKAKGNFHVQTSVSPSPLSPKATGKISVTSSEKGALDPENEIARNREFYRTQDVRPPCTYAALIRHAINESVGRQLTLNEIYTWFQNTFAYFRRNAATWKNAVRHNLSLHKCFMRVENVKGAVWTVNEEEYHRRRPQRGSLGGPHASSRTSPSRTQSPERTVYNGNDLLSYQNRQRSHHAALVAEHQAYLQGLRNTLGMGTNGHLRSDDCYYPGLTFGLRLKREVIDDLAEEENVSELREKCDENDDRDEEKEELLDTSDGLRKTANREDAIHDNPEDLSSSWHQT